MSAGLDYFAARYQQGAVMTIATIKSLVAAYEATGRCAHVYPRRKQVSLSGGRAISYEDAAKHMRAVLFGV